MDKRSEIDNLIELLEVDDEGIFETVRKSIYNMGTKVIPNLEFALERSADEKLNERLKLIIDNLRLKLIFKEIYNWLTSENPDIMQGFLLLSKSIVSDISKDKISERLGDLKLELWLNLGVEMSLNEKIDVLNDTFYNKFGFTYIDYFEKGSTIYDSLLPDLLYRKGFTAYFLTILYYYIGKSCGLPLLLLYASPRLPVCAIVQDVGEDKKELLELCVLDKGQKIPLTLQVAVDYYKEVGDAPVIDVFEDVLSYYLELSNIAFRDKSSFNIIKSLLSYIKSFRKKFDIPNTNTDNFDAEDDMFGADIIINSGGLHISNFMDFIKLNLVSGESLDALNVGGVDVTTDKLLDFLNIFAVNFEEAFDKSVEEFKNREQYAAEEDYYEDGDFDNKEGAFLEEDYMEDEEFNEEDEEEFKEERNGKQVCTQEIERENEEHIKKAEFRQYLKDKKVKEAVEKLRLEENEKFKRYEQAERELLECNKQISKETENIVRKSFDMEGIEGYCCDKD